MEPAPRTYRWPFGLIECFVVGVLVIAGSWWWAQPRAEVGSARQIETMDAGDQAKARQSIDLLVDVNHANAATLSVLPGLGPSLAARIIQDRNTRGRFKTPADLIRVKGIAEKKLAQLRPWIACGEGVAPPDSPTTLPSPVSSVQP
jgi:DNA uptake protein ComE-like DNA-binding protein